MANSTMISEIKNIIVKEIIRDELIVNAIDAPDITSPEQLIYTHIFDYHQNPNVLKVSGTFIMLVVHIPKSFDRNNTFISPTLDIWIISHYNHMKVDNIPKVKSNRNDYLSMLLDKKFNGIDIGYGGLELSSNIEDAYQDEYLFRKMTFITKDLNKSLCDR